jgi:hypothetical protein
MPCSTAFFAAMIENVVFPESNVFIPTSRTRFATIGGLQKIGEVGATKAPKPVD